MKDQISTVTVIDDDPGIRESLGSLLRSMGFQVKLLSSVSEFLSSAQPQGPNCLVLDIRLPGQSGLDYRVWRHSDDSAGHEGRRDRIPHKAVPRPGSA